MSNKSPLPTVFAQKTDQNEQISSLLSACYLRRIRKSFTPSILRHPLSLWTLQVSNDDKTQTKSLLSNEQERVAFFLIGEKFDHGRMKVIADVLKMAASESGFVVVELICGSNYTSSSAREKFFASFNANAQVFVIDLQSGVDFLQGHELEQCISAIISMDPQNGAANLSFNATPHLVLLSTSEGPGSFSANVRCHLSDPNAIVLALPERLRAYGDDGTKSLWIARTALKWMKAAQLTATAKPLPRSRL